tara:strand:- start:415 stop:648 length:234 start_codon:yes stop_codon:yes gene_type:complete
MVRAQKYTYDTLEQRRAIYREKDRINHFKNYWKSNYNIIVPEDQIDFFKANKTIIKKSLPILETLKNLQFVENTNEN